VKLLLDQNLSSTLVPRPVGTYPDTSHVKDLQAQAEDDVSLWRRCRRDGYVLVTKDHDFEDASLHPGPPPKVILLLIGNTATPSVLALLTRHAGRIEAFGLDRERILRLG